jgi:hypothetical protein
MFQRELLEKECTSSSEEEEEVKINYESSKMSSFSK